MNEQLEDIYKNVPGQGKILEDGTWWTNCTANINEITKHHVIPGNYTKVCQAIENANFDCKPFTRWKRLPNE